MNFDNVFVLGGDKRSRYIAEYYRNTALCVTDLTASMTESDRKKLADADLVILGLPAVLNGMVNMPLADFSLPFDKLLDLLGDKTKVAGGRFDKNSRELMEKKNIKWADYSEDEIFQLENAFYTAEGAVSSLIGNTESSLWGMNILITGGGRIARALCSILRGYSCKISVYARNPIVRTSFALDGFEALDSLTNLKGFDAVINTVPADIFPKSIMETLGKDAVVLDLSQRPGYVSKTLCEELGLGLLYLPGIPLTSAPRSAGISASRAAERIFK